MGFLLNCQNLIEFIIQLFQVVSTILTSLSLSHHFSPSPPSESLCNNCALKAPERPALFLTRASFEKEITVIKNNKWRILKGHCFWEDNLQDPPFPDHNFKPRRRKSAAVFKNRLKIKEPPLSDLLGLFIRKIKPDPG